MPSPGFEPAYLSLLRTGELEQRAEQARAHLMDQHYPCYRACDYPPLDRRLSGAGYAAALAAADRYGLRRLDAPR